ncbi:hypothetical protein IB286_02795 [Spongiibacter sp. KMU-158]|uniref:TIGR02001 family outer membrane protein n=1 Tax=Spongiibacter pelagi TaxID=2760804 RepID=A0A927C1S7_9GAMM|nr:TorF family putative porin [Spongiibacter pelagi]MBD2857920.1 hypothetical protein [Spongiibacter pelagi]
MKSMKKMLGLAILAGAPMAASAAEVSGNVTLASDYTFRGISQTSERGAIQGGFDVDFGNGFSLGTWASNIDADAGAPDGTSQQELDIYGGYGFAVSESVSIDLGYIHYIYPGLEKEFNYDEFVVGVSVSDFSVTLVYSPDYFGAGGDDAFILNLDYSLSVNDAVSIDFHVAQTDHKVGVVDSDDGYVDYSVGFNYDVAGVTLGLAYVGTDFDANSDSADDRMVLSISKSL